MKSIRIFGDPVLHRPPEHVDFQHLKWDLNEVLAIMRTEYMCEAGVGIAANQCAAVEPPPQSIIVGVADLEVRERAKKRYPSQLIPEPIIMINPEILENSQLKLSHFEQGLIETWVREKYSLPITNYLPN